MRTTVRWVMVQIKCLQVVHSILEALRLERPDFQPWSGTARCKVRHEAALISVFISQPDTNYDARPRTQG